LDFDDVAIGVQPLSGQPANSHRVYCRLYTVLKTLHVCRDLPVNGPNIQVIHNSVNQSQHAKARERLALLGTVVLCPHMIGSREVTIRRRIPLFHFFFAFIAHKGEMINCAASLRVVRAGRRRRSAGNEVR
jgi:hypothetical protein